jgi:hypothetical protein
MAELAGTYGNGRRLVQTFCSSVLGVPIRLARIIHQPAKSTGEVDFVVQMSVNSTVFQVDEAPQSISSGRPDTVYIGRMGAAGRTASCQPPEAYLHSLVGEPLGLSIAPHRAR